MNPPHPPLPLSLAQAVPERSSDPSQHLKQWLLRAKAAEEDGTMRAMARTTAGIRAGRPRTNAGAVASSKRAQILRMITALEELHRTYNKTLSSRIAIMPRGNHSVGQLEVGVAVIPSSTTIKHQTSLPDVARSLLTHLYSKSRPPGYKPMSAWTRERGQRRDRWFSGMIPCGLSGDRMSSSLLKPQL